MNLSQLLKQDISFRMTDKRLSLFLISFKTLLEAKVPLSRSLEILERTETNRTFIEIIRALEASVSEGKLLSQALADQPKYFDSLLISSVKAGESTGKMPQLLESMADFYGLRHDQRQKIQGALAYPILLMLVTILVVTFILTFVMPTFLGFFEDAGQALPLSTRLLISLAQFLIQWAWLLALALLMIMIGLVVLRRQRSIKESMDLLLFKLPLIGRVQKMAELTKMAGLLHVFWQSGVSTIQALEILKGSMTNAGLTFEMEGVLEDVLQGTRLSTAFSKISIVSPLFSGMLEVGEETGRLADMMAETQVYYQRELAEATQQFIRKIEPMMILIMAVIVGFVVLSIATPMFDLINTTTF